MRYIVAFNSPFATWGYMTYLIPNENNYVQP